MKTNLKDNPKKDHCVCSLSLFKIIDNEVFVRCPDCNKYHKVVDLTK